MEGWPLIVAAAAAILMAVAGGLTIAFKFGASFVKKLVDSAVDNMKLHADVLVAVRDDLKAQAIQREERDRSMFKQLDRIETRVSRRQND